MVQVGSNLATSNRNLWIALGLAGGAAVGIYYYYQKKKKNPESLTQETKALGQHAAKEVKEVKEATTKK
jgi:hypothetical protein